MITAAVAFAVSLLVAAALTPLVRRWAISSGILDQAVSSRKIHERPIPRLGGVAIVAAFFAPFVALLLVESGVGGMFYQNPRSAIGIFVGGLAIAALGIYDDLIGSGAGKKFAVQFGVAALMYYLGFRIDRLANPFGADLELGMLAIPFTLVWIVGVINAMNLIDGLDGLAGGVSLFAVGTTFVVAFNQPNPLLMLFMAALGGAVFGFLFYNFNPATIFMGDTGSMFLGFILAVSAIQTNQKSTTAVAILTPILALGLPILDTFLAMARRAVRGRPLFSADKEHIHHRLMSYGLTHRQAAIALYAACLVLNAVAILLIYANSIQVAVALFLLGGITFFAMHKLGYVQFNRGHYLSDQRRRNRMLRTRVREIGDELRESSEEVEVWEAVKHFASDVDASWIGLSWKLADEVDWHTRELGSDGHREHLAIASSFDIPGGRACDARLEISWSDGRREIDRDDEIALESLVELIAETYTRIGKSGRTSALRATASMISRGAGDVVAFGQKLGSGAKRAGRASKRPHRNKPAEPRAGRAAAGRPPGLTRSRAVGAGMPA